MSLAQDMLMEARASGYLESLETPEGAFKKSVIRSLCPVCGENRVLRFHKVRRVKGPRVFHRCYTPGCKHYKKGDK